MDILLFGINGLNNFLEQNTIFKSIKLLNALLTV